MIRIPALACAALALCASCRQTAVPTGHTAYFPKAIIAKEHVEEAVRVETALAANYRTPAPAGQAWFEVLDGRSTVMIVAGHATAQVREGRVKEADGGTGSLAVMLNRLAGCPVIHTTHLCPSDPNYEDDNDFKRELDRMLVRYKPTVVLDLHASHWYRPYDVDFGTMGGTSLRIRYTLLARLARTLRAEGMRNFSQDYFAAAKNKTVTKWVSGRGVPCVQLEINSTWMLPPAGDPQGAGGVLQYQRFAQVLQGLVRFVESIDGGNRADPPAPRAAPATTRPAATRPLPTRPGVGVGPLGRPFELSRHDLLTVPPSVPGALTVCSFNVQFLGSSKDRDDAALVSILEGFDVVVVQELVAPPYAGQFPDGSAYVPDPQSREFFDLMTASGFAFVLSEEDTGTGDRIHLNSTATEWWVTFYKPDKVTPAEDLPGGFLADDRSNHPDYERVPYAFPFRTTDQNLDLVLISVHLMPGAGSAAKKRRKHELETIAGWIAGQGGGGEGDFIVLGDMNIEDAYELQAVTPHGFLSLNNECQPTNTNVNGPKPYDHVMFDPLNTAEMDTQFDFRVVDLIGAMKPLWGSADRYPGDPPYDHNTFRRYFSDHHPVAFRIDIPDADDDP